MMEKDKLDELGKYLKEIFPHFNNFNVVETQLGFHIEINTKGYPAGTGDIYLDKKVDIITAIEDLNKQVRYANDMGLSVVIETLPAPQTPAAVPMPAIPGQAAWIYNDLPSKTVMSKPQFKLSRLFKEF